MVENLQQFPYFYISASALPRSMESGTWQADRLDVVDIYQYTKNLFLTVWALR